MDTAEDMRKHLNARPHDGTPNARLKGATQILKLTPSCGGQIGLCVADHARGRSIALELTPPRWGDGLDYVPQTMYADALQLTLLHGANNFFHLRRQRLRPA